MANKLSLYAIRQRIISEELNDKVSKQDIIAALMDCTDLDDLLKIIIDQINAIQENLLEMGHMHTYTVYQSIENKLREMRKGVFFDLRQARYVDHNKESR